MTILDSSVGIATLHGTNGPGIKSRGGGGERDFKQPSGPALGVHPASYKISTGLFPDVKRPRRGVNHSSSSCSEVKERVEL